jgi:hypothetical protein
MGSTTRFRVYLEDGTDLEDYVTNGGATWKVGDTLYAGGLPAYRIVEVIPLADIDEYAGIWKVEPAC